MTQDTSKRPPLGLMPRIIHDENRMQAIEEAAGRYFLAQLDIPKEWVTEYKELADRVDKSRRK